MLFCILHTNNPHDQPLSLVAPTSPRPLVPSPTGLSRGNGMGKPVGGDCDLVLANQEPVEAASDLVSANRDAAELPMGNSRRVPKPCASLMLRAREADRDTEHGGKQEIHASHEQFLEVL